jgi:hypothetical protein
MPRQRKASALTARFSKSLASLRQRPSQAKVRSTIQRLRKAFTALDDLQPPAAGPGHRLRGCLALVGTVGKEHLDEREQPTRRAQEGYGPVAVLDAGGMDSGAQEQAQRVDQDVPLLALDLLARVVPLRIDARPPFSALFTLWLSMIATVGLASLPTCSRAWTKSA